MSPPTTYDAIARDFGLPLSRTILISVISRVAEIPPYWLQSLQLNKSKDTGTAIDINFYVARNIHSEHRAVVSGYRTTSYVQQLIMCNVYPSVNGFMKGNRR